MVSVERIENEKDKDMERHVALTSRSESDENANNDSTSSLQNEEMYSLAPDITDGESERFNESGTTAYSETNGETIHGSLHYNQIESEEWENVGRCSVPSKDAFSTEPLKNAIDKNAALLEDLLFQARYHDELTASKNLHHPPPDPKCIITIEVSEQIRRYVFLISKRYHNVGFHSFEHASHVMISAIKLVSMIKLQKRHELVSTEGTIYDPWFHFSIGLAALLHDVDHKGVPNKKLAAEQDPLAIQYGAEEFMSSYAEWNSFDIGMDMLNLDEFSVLSQAIGNKDRIFDIVKDHILCTDIASKERRDLCMQKWESFLFGETRRGSISTCKASNTDQNKSLRLCTRDASRVLADHIMQAADVSHTMQSFDTFMKWNQRLFREILSAYKSEEQCNEMPGSHPVEIWYEDQIGFFKYYVIPLADRLDQSGAFHEEGAKFVNLASKNLRRWEKEGEALTKKMVETTENVDLLPPLIRTNSVQNVNVALQLEMSMDLGNLKMVDSSQEASADSLEALATSDNRKWETEKAAAVDTSIDALIPRLLVKQLIASLQKEVQGRAQNDYSNSLRAAITRYANEGSIQRHYGVLLFVDISGFTYLSQNYPVEDFKTFINEYFTKIMNLVVSFGGEVVKFAGDALYAIWSSAMPEADSNNHQANIEKCTSCAIAIAIDCNKYIISKSYQRTRSVEFDEPSNSNMKEVEEIEILVGSIADRNIEYEEKEATMDVYCGISEGVIAGVDVFSGKRSEFFLIGKPLKDVATAERLAGSGELVVSPSVYRGIQGRNFANVSKLSFMPLNGGFYKVSWPSSLLPSQMIPLVVPNDNNIDSMTPAQELVANLTNKIGLGGPSDGNDDANQSQSDKNDASWKTNKENETSTTSYSESGVVQSDIMQLLESHRHEASRDNVGEFSAELRRVVVIFMNIKYEPNLGEDPRNDTDILGCFQTIFNIISESITSRSGQVRQFINDDKGTVFIASFGLRGSVILQACAAAIDAAKDAQTKLLLYMDIECSIGITLGKVFCGETGSVHRYEYSLLGPSVNLAARLMARGSAGEISCDEEVKNNDGRRHSFCVSGTHKLKGYKEPVVVYAPVEEDRKTESNTTLKLDDPNKFILRKSEMQEVVKRLQHNAGSEEAPQLDPRAIIIKGKAGTGKKTFMSSVLRIESIQKSTSVLEARSCYHDDPFYCWTPIITNILLGSDSVRLRLIRMKKRAKKSPLLASLFVNDALKSPGIDRNVALVEKSLMPYLSLVNDFVFKGFPILKTSNEARSLKDEKKVEKCIEVLSNLITRYIEQNEKAAIISFCSIDSIEKYSKMLIQHLFTSKCNLIFLASADESFDETGFFNSQFGSFSSEKLETVHLDYLDKESTFNLFSWSLKNVIKQDQKLLSHSEAINKIHQISGGMVDVTVELAHAFNTQWCKTHDTFSSSESERMENLQLLLNEIPTATDELVFFRLDQLKPEGQMLLKVASIAGIDQYIFSQNLLEALVLTQSRNGVYTAKRNIETVDEGVPFSVGVEKNVNQFNFMFQGDYFEQTIDSLVEQNFLDEVTGGMSELANLDSEQFRFRSKSEQSLINGLMLDDQKRKIHFEVAMYYSSISSRENSASGEGDDNSSSYSSFSTSDFTALPTSDWKLSHIVALHYDLADVHVPALLHYFDASKELAWLGVRDRSHANLSSAYRMLEKLIHKAPSLEINADRRIQQRKELVSQMVRIIGNKDIPESMQVLTQEHLRLLFADDAQALNKCLMMLIKFGQSVGTIEKEGYSVMADVYLKTILLTMLVLEEKVFKNLISSLSSFLGNAECDEPTRKLTDANFCIYDLTVSFPAFSGLLTFYRDSPIGANKEQESFLANLFVAVTHEADEVVHGLRTKCILCHLYLKHGEEVKALEESETIKNLYDHDTHSLELTNKYGMDWPTICVGTMAGVYIYRGDLTAAMDKINFIEKQIAKLDEGASSTKVMMKGILSSLYMLLRNYQSSATIAKGISETPASYNYFFKASGMLQDNLAKKEQALQTGIPDPTDGDCEVLSVLELDDFHEINNSRPTLNQSIEILSDRGIEAIKAAICLAEIGKLERGECTEEATRKKLQYCQAGLLYLKQSLSQKDANSDERQRNYLCCLNQKAEILCLHGSFVKTLREKYTLTGTEDSVFEFKGSEINTAKAALHECQELSLLHEYYFMLLLVGKSYIKLDIDRTRGEEIVTLAVDRIQQRRSSTDYAYLTECLNRIN